MATFRLARDTRPLKVLLPCLLALYALVIVAHSRPRTDVHRDYLLAILWAIVGASYVLLMLLSISALKPHQQKRLNLSPEGVAYLDQGEVKWQIAWSDLKSVELNKLIDGINGDTEEMIFTTTSGEVHSIPTRSSNLRTMPKKKELLAALESAGFKAELSEIDSYQVRAR